MTGVTRRATNSENITAIATVRPNWRKYWPAMPPMKLTGEKIAAIDSEIAMIASSTRMPVTSVIASRVTRFREKPIASIAQKVGMIDSGSATAVTMVAQIAQEGEH